MTVTYERRGRVAIISIDRPEVRNAIDRSTADLLGEAWRRFEVDAEADVAILHGKGGNFSSGADLKMFDLEDGPDGFLGFTRMKVGKPTIAAIEGFCVAGGLEMALWCDLRVSGASAVFGCFERRFGVPLVDGGTQRLPRIIGMGLALEMILTGRRVEAEEAHAIGLVNTVVSDGDALAYAVMLGERIADSPQETVRSDRMAVLDGMGRPLGEGLEIERQYGLSVLDVAAYGASHFASGAGRSGSPVGRLGPVPAPIDVEDVASTEDHGTTDDLASRSRLRLPKSGVGIGALVLGGESSARLAEHLVELGFVVEVADLGGEPESLEAALDGIRNAIDGLVHSGAVTGEQVAVVAAGEHSPIAIWASTLDTRIGAVVTFGMTPWPQDLQPRYRLSDASYMGHHGGLDPLIDEVKPSSLEMTMRDVGLDATFHLYRRANARFYDSESGDYDQSLADLAWRRTRLFLKRSL